LVAAGWWIATIERELSIRGVIAVFFLGYGELVAIREETNLSLAWRHPQFEAIMTRHSARFGYLQLV
jgi:hypothetical protein